MKITKLILHFNTPKLTEKLCESVPGAIVIDNGSTVPFPGGKNTMIRFENNLGFTCGWNRAIKLMLCSHGWDALWLMNSDIRISRECISRVQTIMDTWLYPMLTPSFNCWMWSCRNMGSGDPRQIKFMEFTAPVIRRDVFEQVGLFDERFTLGYGVDFDYCLRAGYAGIPVYCDDGSRFIHFKSKSITNLEQYKEMANAEMRAGMAIKYGPHWRSLVGNLR